jgi:hypothetical protein
VQKNGKNKVLVLLSKGINNDNRTKSPSSQHIFELLWIIEGATEKVSQIIMLLESKHNKNHCFNEYECVFGLLKQ